jgi:hypothetical protein
MPERRVDNRALRQNMIGTLQLLAERYPNLRVGQIIGNAVNSGDMYFVTDEELARGLNQLFISYTQLEAAGIKP